MEKYIRDLAYQCCFCNKGIVSSKVEPCDLNILTNIDKSKENQCDQTLYCHLACFKEILSAQMQAYFVLDSKGCQLTHHKPKLNHLDASLLITNYTCCICDEYIVSDDTDPCDINVMINIDKSEEDQYNQTFYCHVACFKDSLHEDIQGYLVAAIPE